MDKYFSREGAPPLPAKVLPSLLLFESHSVVGANGGLAPPANVDGSKMQKLRVRKFFLLRLALKLFYIAPPRPVSRGCATGLDNIQTIKTVKH